MAQTPAWHLIVPAAVLLASWHIRQPWQAALDAAVSPPGIPVTVVEVPAEPPGGWWPDRVPRPQAKAQRAALLAELKRRRSQWAARGPADYRLVVRGLCFCAPESLTPTTTVVRAGRVAAVRDSRGRRPARAEGTTVEDLFALAEKWLRGDDHQVEVRYHPRLGYPVEVSTDPDLLTTDDQFTLRAELRPLAAVGDR